MVENVKTATQSKKLWWRRKPDKEDVIWAFVAIVGVLMGVLNIGGMYYDSVRDQADRDSEIAEIYKQAERERLASQIALEGLTRELADDTDSLAILNTVVNFYCKVPVDGKVYSGDFYIFAAQQWETNWRSDLIDLPYGFGAATSERCG